MASHASSTLASALLSPTARLHDIIERALGLLDAIHGDPDLEESHDAEQDHAELGIADLDGAAEQGLLWGIAA